MELYSNVSFFSGFKLPENQTSKMEAFTFNSEYKSFYIDSCSCPINVQKRILKSHFEEFLININKDKPSTPIDIKQYVHCNYKDYKVWV